MKQALGSLRFSDLTLAFVCSFLLFAPGLYIVVRSNFALKYLTTFPSLTRINDWLVLAVGA